jgi:two-component system response regulator HydG
MRAADLDLRDLFELQPKGGVLRFAGERAVLFDAAALGLLRRELIDLLGVTAARAVLTRFGYAHGARTAETLRDALPWASEDEWRRAGGRLHRLQGLVTFEPVPRDPKAAGPAPFAEALWKDSYEAEQHLLCVGQSTEPVCWTLTGFASGYLSFAHGRPIYCIETKCRGRGDAVCRMVGKPHDEWGAEAEAFAPFYERDCLDAALRRLRDGLRKAERKLRAAEKASEDAGGSSEPFGVVARSDAMRHVVSLARRVARSDVTVLVTGESGVGKERIARLIHEESARMGHPFVAINCGAVPETLLESELFGHARGAFTGASMERVGLFEAAHGGTLLLDEVSQLPLPMQVKLLRVLQEREVRRLGETRDRKIDVRLLAATNDDLAELVASGRFREDLYYRLRVVDLPIPPLRERPDDILPLARTLLARAATRVGRPTPTLAPSACEKLVRHTWPGNVRELGNAIERAVALAEGARIEAHDLPPEVVGLSERRRGKGALRPLADIEREHILAVLDAHRGHKAKTAATLEIGIATLFRKLKAYGR